MANSIIFSHNKAKYLEMYTFLEDGEIVKTLLFTTWNKGNRGDEIVQEKLAAVILALMEKGWTYDSLDLETQLEYGVLFREPSPEKGE